MIKRAQELLRGQEERKMELEKGFNVERVSLGEKLVAELREALVALGCEDLLDVVSTEEVTGSNAELEAQIAELKELNKKLKASATRATNNLEPVKAELKEAKKTIKDQAKEITRLNKVVEEKERAIKSLDYKLTQDANESKLDVEALEKELKDAKEQIKWFKGSASTWQSKYTKLFNETKDSNNNDVLSQALKAKDEYIVKLEKQLQDKAYNAANDGYVVNGVEVSVKIVNDLNDQVSKLQEELAQKEKEIAALQQAAICYENTKQQNKNNTKEEEIVIEKEVIVEKEGTNKEYFELNTNVKFKSETYLYESGDHYVIAKPNIKDIVVVPRRFNVEVSGQDFVKYEDLLVNKFGYSKERQEISPVTVTYSDAKHKAFLARTEAVESLYVFSYKDVLTGYVVNNYKVYSWSWNQAHKEPYIVDLGQKAKGKKRCEVSPCDRKALFETIKAMKAEYDQKVKAYAEANGLYNVTEEKAVESQNEVKNKLAGLFNYQQETERIAASAQKPQVVVEKNNQEVNNSANKPQANYSTSLNSFVDEMFS